MRPFIFRLEVLLRLREQEQQDAFSAYGVAIRERQSKELACQSQSAALQDLQENVRRLRESVFPASLQPHYFAALQDGEANLKRLLKELAEAEEHESKMLAEFIEAKSRVDMLLKLKSSRQKKHIYEETRKEEKEIEDLFNARYASSVHNPDSLS